MKIAFNALQSGCGCNGGTNTILKSSKVLEKLGHRCDIIAKIDNFTWFDHKPVIKHVPEDLDCIINVAAVDYKTTIELSVPIKAAWWRAHELWSNKEDYLRNCYTDTEIKNIVNSKGMQQLLATYGASSIVIYQGIDLDKWSDRKLRPKNKTRIGCLYNKKPTKRWQDFVELVKILGPDKYEYVGMGSAKPEDCSFLTEFKLNANVDELNNLYSSCHIWLAPTESEGLHNVPMEAALCGCLIVCSDHPMNGMILDYAFDDTAMIYKFGDLDEAVELIKNPDWSLVNSMQKFLKTIIGNREGNMKKLISLFNN